LPNFGASERLHGELTMRAYGQAMAAFLSALDLDGVTLVGHSLGGAVAQACAALAPEHVARLLLIDSPAPSGFHAPEASLRGAEVLAAEPSEDARRAMIAQALPGVMPTRRPPYFDELVEEALRIPPDAIVPNANALETMDLRDLVGAYPGPVLVLRGGRDALVTEAMARATVDAYGSQRSRAVTWEDVGHSPQIEAPDRFATLLLEFAIGRQPGGTAMT
ncbi:MAG: alpha/beta hydrolase, partial [Deinococcales bacterium]